MDFFDVLFFAGVLRVTFGVTGRIDLVTLPDLVLPNTTAGFSSTAGAGGSVLRARPALALGFGGAFLVSVCLAGELFFGAATFLVTDDFYQSVSKETSGRNGNLALVEVLVGAFVGVEVAGFAGGFVASFLANFTRPDEPLGSEKVPFFSPATIALLI